MCGRYTIVNGDMIVEVIHNVTMPAKLHLVGRYNAAPSQMLPVIANDSREVQMMRWGLIPPWADDEKVGFKMINARAETLASKPVYRGALAQRRCLVPADGFYEWRKNADGTKTPMYIHMKEKGKGGGPGTGGGAVFAFAGLWERWVSPQGEEVKSFTIITTSANELLKPIHDRMPAIIPAEGYGDWLRAEEMPAEVAAAWLRPYPAEKMIAEPVRPLVNSPKNEGPDLIAPAGEKPPVAAKAKPRGGSHGQGGLFGP